MFAHEYGRHPSWHSQPENGEQASTEKEWHIESPFASEVAAKISNSCLASILVSGNAARRFADQEKEAYRQKKARHADKNQSEAPGRH